MQFQAQAFQTDLDGGRAAGIIDVSAVGVAFKCPGASVLLPINGLEITRGGANERLVFFRHAAHPDWSIYTADTQVLRCPTLLEHPETADQLSAMGRRRLGRMGIGIAAVLLILAMPVVFYLSLGGISAVIADKVPAEWEVELGEAAVEEYQRQYRVLQDEGAAIQLQEMAELLTNGVSDSRYDFQFRVSEDPALNAFAVPGGIVVVNAGLIMAAEDAEELLGVLSHEIAHVTEQHGLRNMISSVGAFLVLQALLGDVGGLMGTLASMAPFIVSQQYSQGFESDADERGVVLMQSAGVDPSGLVTFFERLLAREAEIKGEKDEGALAEALDSTLGFLSSHPATQDRIDEISAMIGGAGGPYRELDQQFYALRTSVQEWVSKTGEEQHED